MKAIVGSVKVEINGEEVTSVDGDVELKPEVGMGATARIGSDRLAYTIVRVSPSGKTVWVKEDDAKRIDNNGMSECQNYEYTRNESNPEVQIRKNNRGQWKSGDTKFVLGCRSQYYDYSF